MFVLAILLAEVTLLSRLDRRLFGTWVTPFSLLALPYTAVVLLAFVLASALDFVPLYPTSVIVWIVGLFVVWASGTFLAWGLLDLRGSGGGVHLSTRLVNDDFQAVRLATILAWIAMPIMLYGLIVSKNAAGGWSQIGTLEFKGAYAHGVHGHAQELSALVTILLIGLYRRGNKFQLFTIVILFIFITLSQVKGHTIVVLIAGLLFRTMRDTFRLSFWKFVAFFCATYLFFNMAYLIGALVLTPERAFDGSTYADLARHYFYYLLGSPLALGEALRSGINDLGGNWTVVFSPFINLYRAALGVPPIDAGGTSHAKGVYVDLTATGLGTHNVYTFFGTLYLYFGAMGGIIYVLIVGFLCYGFMIAVKRRQDAWLTAAYCLIAAQLFMGFFELYFWLLTVYEVTAFGLILSFGSRYYRETQQLPERVRSC